jgi:hypothetical protein
VRILDVPDDAAVALARAATPGLLDPFLAGSGSTGTPG